MISLCTLLLALSPGVPQTQQQLEADFEKALSGVAFIGHFTADDAPNQAPTPERYEITKITKLQGNYWRFLAKIEYGTRSVSLPLDLEVEWAGDTPVITLTDFPVMGMGTFTSRVVVYRDRYAGTWQGEHHGGHLFGVIEKLGEAGEGAEAPGEAGEAEQSGSEGGGQQADGPGDADSAAGGAALAGRATTQAVGPLAPEPLASDTSQNWPSFRGPRAAGVVDGYETPVEWDVETGENVVWKTRIPGMAHSSPVIWGDRIFLTTAVKDGEEAELKVGLYGSIAPVDDDSVHEMRVLCVDKHSGEILWSKLAFEGVPAIKRHPKGSHAASSPATDGRAVVAFFGSEGLYCYDMDGRLRWSKDLGRLESRFYMVPGSEWGFASSPVIFEDKVFVECDVMENSFVAAFDLATGEELWRTGRDEVPTWGTPTVDVREGRRQVIVNGLKHIGGYDADTGEELWKLAGGGDIPVPTPVVADDLIYVTNAHGRMAPIFAIRADASGEVSMSGEGEEQLAWWKRSRGNYMQTPLVYGPYLFCCSDHGILACYDKDTGEEISRERLGSGNSGFTASIVASDGKIYATAEAGEVYVLPADGGADVLAINDMGEECMASPAISEGTMYWRGRRHLFAVSQR